MKQSFFIYLCAVMLFSIATSSNAKLLTFDINAQYSCTSQNCDTATTGTLSFDDSLLRPQPWDTNIIGDVIPGSSLNSFSLFGLSLEDMDNFLLIVSYITDWPDQTVTPGLHVTFQAGAVVGTPGVTEYEQYSFFSLSDQHLRDWGMVAYNRCPPSGIDCLMGTGVYSVTPAIIPIPPALWLFSSGLLGFIGVARRKNAT